ncbi:sensor histidine kinase [Roseateles oligotrophus]|uniref:histidine kinase n=1 Tax=Roseateles oligotrophus TaxID=1769250 RepID=A0ABT2YGD1_9BURK|nr:HAMP domain-containing sensor histidine kinase [Roseateles oligotrophus]MCV2369076.1 HAMP domain-containing histidine kinase [Roseateles oligotrophus]
MSEVRESDLAVETFYLAVGSLCWVEVRQRIQVLLQGPGNSLRFELLHAWLEMRQGRAVAPDLIDRARRLELDASLDPTQRAELLMFLALSGKALGLTVQAMKNESEALALFESAGRRVGACMAAQQMLLYLVVVGDLDELDRLLPALEKRLLGRFDWMDVCFEGCRATAAYGRAEAGDEGSRRHCIDLYRNLYERTKASHLQGFRGMVGTNLAVNLVLAGEFEAARLQLQELELLDAGADQRSVVLFQAWRAYTRAQLGLREGRLDLAAAELGQAIQLELGSQRSANLQIKIMDAQAECAFRQGRIDDGRRAIQGRQMVQDEVLRQLRAKHNAGMAAMMREAQLAVELRASNVELRKAYDEMEQRVRERSAELVEAQQALQRHAQRGVISKLLIGVAHQLNTPLGTAGFTVSALRDQVKGLQAQLQAPMRKQDLLLGLAQLDQAAALVESNLLRSHSLLSRFSELGLHEHLHQSRRVEMAPWLREQVQALQPEWRAAGISPELQLEEGIEWLGAVDALAQVLQHLFKNALRFGWVAGSLPEITLLFARFDPAPGLCIEVQDRGPGMSEARRAHAFEPFAEQLLTEGGLGLVLVRNLVEGLMRGQVELLPNQPQGLRVRIILPDSESMVSKVKLKNAPP